MKALPYAAKVHGWKSANRGYPLAALHLRDESWVSEHEGRHEACPYKFGVPASRAAARHSHGFREGREARE